MAFIYQDSKRVEKLGRKAPWYVRWVDPHSGKKRTEKVGTKEEAEKRCKAIEAEITLGLRRDKKKTKWSEFVAEFSANELPKKSIPTQRLFREAMNRFSEMFGNKAIASITTRDIDEFITARQKDRGHKPGSTMSPASINKELRHLKAALHKAERWGYTEKMPDFDMLREVKKLPTYVPPDDFAAIYKACESAKYPADGLPFPATDWWRALLVFLYVTGWRVGEALMLRWSDVDLESGHAITRGDENKGRRDELAPLQTIAIEHIRKIASFEPVVFPWYKSERTLYDEFHRIQTEAGINKPCRKKHEHTRACHMYGFHDLRRAFASLNAAKLGPEALQSLMRHQSYATTQRYINMANQLNQKVADIYVPEFLTEKSG